MRGLANIVPFFFGFAVLLSWTACRDFSNLDDDVPIENASDAPSDSETEPAIAETDECAHRCAWSAVGDSVCDASCNVAACGYDNGDCEVQVAECASGCPWDQLGNGNCQFECDVEECDDDGGDCGLYDDDECPLNSGYFCACDRDLCDDGSTCVWFGPQDLGLCTRECEEPNSSYGCESEDWGIAEIGGGFCVDDFGPGGKNHCWLSCSFQEGDNVLENHCPPGLICMTDFPDGIGFCFPSY